MIQVTLNAHGTSLAAEIAEGALVGQFMQALAESEAIEEFPTGAYVLRHGARVLSADETLPDKAELTLQSVTHQDIRLHVTHEATLTAQEIAGLIQSIDGVMRLLFGHVSGTEFPQSANGILHLTSLTTTQRGVEGLFEPIETVTRIDKGKQWESTMVRAKKVVEGFLTNMEKEFFEVMMTTSKEVAEIGDRVTDFIRACRTYQQVSLLLGTEELQLGRVSGHHSIFRVLPLSSDDEVLALPGETYSESERESPFEQILAQLALDVPSVDLSPEVKERLEDTFTTDRKEFREIVSRMIQDTGETSITDWTESSKIGRRIIQNLSISDFSRSNLKAQTISPPQTKQVYRLRPSTGSTPSQPILPPEHPELKRYPNVDFPAKVQRGEEVPLRVRLTLDNPHATNPNLDIFQKHFVPPPSDQERATLTVTVHTDVFEALDEPWRLMPVPMLGDSELVSFLLKPYDDVPLGKYDIVLGFFKGGRLIGNVTVHTEISNPHSGGQAGFDGSIGHIHEGERSSPNVITITRYGKDFYIATTPSNYHQVGQANWVGDFDTARKKRTWGCWLRSKVLDKLSQHWTESEYRAILQQLKGVGNTLLEDYIPQQTRDFLQGIPPESKVSIFDPWMDLRLLPWELVHDQQEDCFWAEKYMFIRTLSIGSDQPVRNSNHQKKFGLTNGCHFLSSKVRDNVKVAPIPSKIKPCTIANLQVHIDKTAEDWVSWISAKSPSLILITCHGDENFLYLGPHDTINRLLPDNVKATKASGCGLLFANACMSATTTSSLGDPVGFADAAWDAGIATFIGTFAEIPTVPAIKFVNHFCFHLLDSNMPVERALYETRKQIAEDESNTSPFWLFYTMYGYPDVTFRRQYAR